MCSPDACINVHNLVNEGFLLIYIAHYNVEKKSKNTVALKEVLMGNK